MLKKLKENILLGIATILGVIMDGAFVVGGISLIGLFFDLDGDTGVYFEATILCFVIFLVCTIARALLIVIFDKENDN